MFGRPPRCKIPSLTSPTPDPTKEALRDRDLWLKDRAKTYADNARHASTVSFCPGDLVFIQQPKLHKLSTNFCPDPLTVVEVHGSAVKARRKDGSIVERNVSFFRPFYHDDLPTPATAEPSPVQHKVVPPPPSPPSEAPPLISASSTLRQLPAPETSPPRRSDRRVSQAVHLKDFVCS